MKNVGSILMYLGASFDPGCLRSRSEDVSRRAEDCAGKNALVLILSSALAFL